MSTLGELKKTVGGVLLINEDELFALSRWVDNEYGALRALNEITARADALDGPIPSEEIQLFVRIAVTLPSIAEAQSGYTAAIGKSRRRLQHLVSKERSGLQRDIRDDRITPDSAAERVARLKEAGKALKSASAPLIRSDRKGSRGRTLFLRDLSALVRDLTGRWMDSEVAAIASAVLGCPIDTEQVRNTNRASSERKIKHLRLSGPRPPR